MGIATLAICDYDFSNPRTINLAQLSPAVWADPSDHLIGVGNVTTIDDIIATGTNILDSSYQQFATNTGGVYTNRINFNVANTLVEGKRADTQETVIYSELVSGGNVQIMLAVNIVNNQPTAARFLYTDRGGGWHASANLAAVATSILFPYVSYNEAAGETGIATETDKGEFNFSDNGSYTSYPENISNPDNAYLFSGEDDVFFTSFTEAKDAIKNNIPFMGSDVINDLGVVTPPADKKILFKNGAYIQLTHSTSSVYYIDIFDNTDTRVYRSSSYGMRYPIGLWAVYIAIDPFTQNPPASGYDIQLFGVYSNYVPGTSTLRYWVGNIATVPAAAATALMTDLPLFKPGASYKDDISTTGGGGGKSGEGGVFVDTSDPVSFASLPAVSAIGSGFIKVYNPTPAQLQSFAGEMNDTTVLDEIKKFFVTDPMEAIISLHIVPCPVTTGASSALKIGNHTFTTTMSVVTGQYTQIDLGTVEIEPWTGSCLDYSPNTKAQIYLPYLGYKPIDIDAIMGKTLALKYNVDILTGQIIAMLSNGDTCLYSWEGSGIRQLPTTSSNHNNLVSALIGTGLTAVGIGVSAATGNPVGIAAGISSAVGQVANVAANSKPTINHGSGLTGSGGAMGYKTPHIILERPKQSLPEDYENINGFPSNITLSVGECSGFTVFEQIHCENTTATQEEKDEIEQLLKEGVII